MHGAQVFIACIFEAKRLVAHGACMRLYAVAVDVAGVTSVATRNTRNTKTAPNRQPKTDRQTDGQTDRQTDTHTLNRTRCARRQSALSI